MPCRSRSALIATLINGVSLVRCIYSVASCASCAQRVLFCCRRSDGFVDRRTVALLAVQLEYSALCVQLRNSHHRRYGGRAKHSHALAHTHMNKRTHTHALARTHARPTPQQRQHSRAVVVQQTDGARLSRRSAVLHSHERALRCAALRCRRCCRSAAAAGGARVYLGYA